MTARHGVAPGSGAARCAPRRGACRDPRRVLAILLIAVVGGFFAAGLIARGEAAGVDARAYWAGVRIWLNGGDPYHPVGPVPAVRLRTVAAAAVRALGTAAVGRGLVRLARRDGARPVLDDRLGVPTAAARGGARGRGPRVPDRGQHRHGQHHALARAAAVGRAVHGTAPGRPHLGARDVDQVVSRAASSSSSPPAPGDGASSGWASRCCSASPRCRSPSRSSRRSSGSGRGRSGSTTWSCSGPLVPWFWRHPGPLWWIHPREWSQAVRRALAAMRRASAAGDRTLRRLRPSPVARSAGACGPSSGSAPDRFYVSACSTSLMTTGVSAGSASSRRCGTTRVRSRAPSREHQRRRPRTPPAGRCPIPPGPPTMSIRVPAVSRANGPAHAVATLLMPM